MGFEFNKYTMGFKFKTTFTPEWLSFTKYKEGAEVKYRNNFYVATTSHISVEQFNKNYWKLINK